VAWRVEAERGAWCGGWPSAKVRSKWGNGEPRGVSWASTPRWRSGSGWCMDDTRQKERHVACGRDATAWGRDGVRSGTRAGGDLPSELGCLPRRG
jgi:hypothetical protein